MGVGVPTTEAPMAPPVIAAPTATAVTASLPESEKNQKYAFGSGFRTQTRAFGPERTSPIDLSCVTCRRVHRG